MTDDRKLLLRHVYRRFTSACRCFLSVETSVPLPKPEAFLYHGCHKSERNKMGYM